MHARHIVLMWMYLPVLIVSVCTYDVIIALATTHNFKCSSFQFARMTLSVHLQPHITWSALRFRWPGDNKCEATSPFAHVFILYQNFPKRLTVKGKIGSRSFLPCQLERKALYVHPHCTILICALPHQPFKSLNPNGLHTWVQIYVRICMCMYMYLYMYICKKHACTHRLKHTIHAGYRSPRYRSSFRGRSWVP